MRIPDDEWEAVVANVPLVSADFVIRHEGGVPFGFRENRPARGRWSILGGIVFEDETLTDVLYRVVDEGLGVNVTTESRLSTFEHSHDTSDIEGIDSKHYLATAFEVTFDDDNLEMDIQHSQLKIFKPPYEGLHPHVEQYLDVLG